MSNKLLYLPSAANSAGSGLVAHKFYPKIAEAVYDSLREQEPDIDFGVLSNAFSEKEDLKGFHDIYAKKGYTLMGDSGGLQIINTGAEISPELKKIIYDRQSKYSTLALSFDEIPLMVLNRGGGGSFANTVEYVDSWFKSKAIESGDNLADQINHFIKTKSKSKVLFIIQGRTFKEAREWSYFQYQQIKDIPGHEDYIGGLALGSTGKSGPRNLADFILRFQNELEFLPESMRLFLHILGAGSVSKIISYLVVDDNYFLKGTVISADSTTQSRAMVFGNYVYYDDKKQKLIQTAAGRGITESSMFVTRKIYDFALPFMEKYAEEYGIKDNIKDFDAFRNHYSQYNDADVRKRADFRAGEKLKKEHIKELNEEELKTHIKTEQEGDYEYAKRSRIAGFFWGTSMMSDFLKMLESIKQRARAHRAGNAKEKLRIEESLKNSLPQNLYKPIIKIIDLKSHTEYMKDSKDQIIVGHPFTQVLDDKYHSLVKDGLVKLSDGWYNTDTYQGELRCRKLSSSSAQDDINSTSNKRGQFLNMLQGATIDGRATEENTIEEIDEW